MARKGENIYQRKDGRWEGRYIKSRSVDGKAIYGYIYASSYKEVRRKRNEAIAKVDPKQLEKRVPVKVAPLKDISEEWLNNLQPQIKRSTYCKYHNLLRTHILPELGEEKINTLSVSKLQSFCDKLLTVLSPKTVSDILSIVRRILNYAQIHEYCPICSGKEIIIRVSSPDIVVLSIPDQKILYRYLHAHITRKNLGILFSLFTGIRLGELCALKWADISIEEKTIYVHKTMQRLNNFDSTGPKTYIDISSPKSKCSIRTIPLPDALISYIQNNYPHQHGYILTSREEESVEPRKMQKYFKKIQEECGLVPVNFHALRHTFATRCIELGFDVKSLSEILGHASVNITMNRYVHPSMELKQQNMQKLSSLLTDM